MIINNELNLNSKCEEHNKKNNIGFCCSCYSEICSKCADFYCALYHDNDKCQIVLKAPSTN